MVLEEPQVQGVDRGVRQDWPHEGTGRLKQDSE